MDSKLIFAIITITLALVFYTVGVFGERKARSLHKKHVIIFWLGLVCDTIGTVTMSKIANSGTAEVTQNGLNIHAYTGLVAIVLMLFHAVWATWVLYKKDQAKKETFHKFSFIVWIIWLIPYVIGMIVGMS